MQVPQEQAADACRPVRDQLAAEGRSGAQSTLQGPSPRFPVAARVGAQTQAHLSTPIKQAMAPFPPGGLL